MSVLDRGTAWLDTGTFQALMQASQFIEIIEDRQGLVVGSIEVAALEMGYIDEKKFGELAQPLIKSGYGQRLLGILNKEA